MTAAAPPNPAQSRPVVGRPFTRDNAREMSERGANTRRRRSLLRRNLLDAYKELLRRLDVIESKTPPDAPVRLAATRAQLARIDGQMLDELNAQAPDYAKLERMARTKALLIDQERIQARNTTILPAAGAPPSILPPPTPEPFPPEAIEP